MNDKRKCRCCRNFVNGHCVIADEMFEVPDFASEIDYAIGDGELEEAVREIMDSNRKKLQEATSDEAYDIVVGEMLGEFEALVSNFVRDKFDNIPPGLEVADYDFCCARFE